MCTEDLTTNNHDEVIVLARGWLVRLTSGDVTEQELDAFKHWLAASEHHRQAFARERVLWRQLDDLEAVFRASMPANGDDKEQQR